MEIKRNILKELVRWKEDTDRRPLIIQGARQIGKTWVMKRFGESNYKYTAYFNFDENEELCKEFEKTKDVKRLLVTLALYCEVPILPGDTLIVFDEIQECPDALNSLKYFCENAPEYHVMAAGSLLGVAVNRKKGFPVGKVDFLEMYPVSFDEYYGSYNEKFSKVVDSCHSLHDFLQLPEIIKSNLEEAYRHYRVSGGLPKVAVASLKGLGIEKINREQNELLTSYYNDFPKHAPLKEFPRIAQVWNSLPSQLTKENRKFLYKVVKPGARAREYESALTWLREAGLIFEIYCSTKPGLPISTYDDLAAFKIYMIDCGLLRALAKMPADLFVADHPMYTEFKGALTENYVLQQMLASSLLMPRYWVSQGTAEVDFLMQFNLEIIPIEVKAGGNIASRSLGVYIKKYQPKYAVVVSERELKVAEGDTTVIHLPLYLTPWLSRIMS